MIILHSGTRSLISGGYRVKQGYILLSCQRSSNFSNSTSICLQSTSGIINFSFLISWVLKPKPCRILPQFTLRKGKLKGRLKEEVSTWVKRNALLDNYRTLPRKIFNTVKKLSKWAIYTLQLSPGTGSSV